MPTSRVYYAEREPVEATATPSERLARLGRTDKAELKETEWEDEVEGDSQVEALDAFFRNHVPDRTRVQWVDDEGRGHSLGGTEDFDPDKTYVWVENDRPMEFQGIDEATPGMVTCPLCNGHGEVEEALAAEFHEVWDEEESEDEEGEDDESRADVQG